MKIQNPLAYMERETLSNLRCDVVTSPWVTSMQCLLTALDKYNPLLNTSTKLENLITRWKMWCSCHFKSKHVQQMRASNRYMCEASLTLSCYVQVLNVKVMLNRQLLPVCFWNHSGLEVPAGQLAAHPEDRLSGEMPGMGRWSSDQYVPLSWDTP